MGKKSSRGLAKGKGQSSADLAGLERQSSFNSSTSFLSSGSRLDEQDLLEEVIDALQGKRAAAREKALHDCKAYLLEDVQGEDLYKNESTLIGRCLNCIRRGGSSESALASNVLGLLFLSLPEPSESLLEDVLPDLQRAATPSSTSGSARASSEASEARQAAIEALAVAALAASEDDDTTLRVMGVLRGLWHRGGDPGPCAAAVRGWSLLFTSLTRGLGASTVESLLQSLAQLLQTVTDVEVRSAAGEALALLYHCSGMVGESYDDEDGDGEDDGVEEYRSDDDLSEQPSEQPGSSGLDDVLDCMRDLATHNRGDVLRRSKRDKASLRSAFRGLLGTMQDGSVQAQKIKLQYGDVLVVDTLEGLVVLGAVRRYLGSGFQAHLQRNPLLHRMFSFQPSLSRPAALLPSEKRALRSPSSVACKSRTAERKGNRAAKHASRHSLVCDM